jgi:hypothetical protein
MRTKRFGGIVSLFVPLTLTRRCPSVASGTPAASAGASDGAIDAENVSPEKPSVGHLANT